MDYKMIILTKFDSIEEYENEVIKRELLEDAKKIVTKLVEAYHDFLLIPFDDLIEGLKKHFTFDELIINFDEIKEFHNSYSAF